MAPRTRKLDDSITNRAKETVTRGSNELLPRPPTSTAFNVGNLQTRPTNAMQPTTIQLCGGKISALSNGKMLRARGVRYATARRFQKPQPVDSWTETQDCTQPAPSCPQSRDPLRVAIGDVERTSTQSEDCLRVSIIAPVDAKNAPVMVFFHGGAYIFGAGDVDAYAPWGLASRGVVAITVDYRLGIFGYLLIPGVAPANLGLLDQIEALRWMQKNVGAFGGDAGNVTVFGQSAGGDSIYCMLVAEGTEYLFHRAIMQSSPCPSRLHEANRVEMHIAMSSVAQKDLDKHGYECSIERLPEIQLETLKEAAKYTPTLANYAPIFGSYPLPPDYKLAERSAAVATKKPIFLGVTRDEGTPFEKVFGRDIDDADRVTTEDFLDGQFELHKQIEAAIGRPSPFYVREWHPEGNDGLKACHCLELPLLLGNWEAWKEAPMLQGDGDVREVVERLGGCMQDLWVAFARGEDVKRGYFVIGGAFEYP